MKIGILGATGHFGRGLVYRWSKNHNVIIGSRDKQKAMDTAQDCNSALRSSSVANPVTGMSNKDTVESSDVIVLSIRFGHLIPLLEEISDSFDNKVVISPVVPIVKRTCFEYAPPPEGSAALAIRGLLPSSCRLVAALHTIPAADLKDLRKTIEGDVVLCGDSTDAKEEIRDLIEEITFLRGLDGGGIEVSKLIESAVPLLLNVKLFSLKRDLSIKFV